MRRYSVFILVLFVLCIEIENFQFCFKISEIVVGKPQIPFSTVYSCFAIGISFRIEIFPPNLWFSNPPCLNWEFGFKLVAPYPDFYLAQIQLKKGALRLVESSVIVDIVRQSFWVAMVLGTADLNYCVLSLLVCYILLNKTLLLLIIGLQRIKRVSNER